jgi:hypothetical protein
MHPPPAVVGHHEEGIGLRSITGYSLVVGLAFFDPAGNRASFLIIREVLLQVLGYKLDLAAICPQFFAFRFQAFDAFRFDLLAIPDKFQPVNGFVCLFFNDLQFVDESLFDFALLAAR